MEFKPETEIQTSNKFERGKNILKENVMKAVVHSTQIGKHTFMTDAPTKIPNIFLLKILLQLLNSYLHT